jgi:hypothetical protein
MKQLFLVLPALAVVAVCNSNRGNNARAGRSLPSVDEARDDVAVAAGDLHLRP